MNIHIEYCIKWNYGPEFDRVSNIIKSIDSNIKIKPIQGCISIIMNYWFYYLLYQMKYLIKRVYRYFFGIKRSPIKQLKILSKKLFKLWKNI